jgi:hypothetical protein
MTFVCGMGFTATQILRKRLAPQKKAKQINKMRKAQRTMGAKDIDVSTFGFDFQSVHSDNWRDTPIPPPQKPRLRMDSRHKLFRASQSPDRETHP